MIMDNDFGLYMFLQSMVDMHNLHAESKGYHCSLA